jgi:hypothetical protein
VFKPLLNGIYIRDGVSCWFEQQKTPFFYVGDALGSAFGGAFSQV